MLALAASSSVFFEGTEDLAVDGCAFERNDGNDVIVDFDPAMDVIAIQETPSLFVDIAGGTVIEFGATQIYVLGVTADLVEARLTFL